MFNIPWHQYPFTVDLRTAVDQSTGSLAAALALPFILPLEAARLREGLRDAVATVKSGWLPYDNFLSTTLVVPLSVSDSKLLAGLLLTALDVEGDAKTAGDGSFDAVSAALEATYGSSHMSPVAAAACQVATVVRSLANGEACPGKHVQLFRWIPAPVAVDFLRRYTFMARGRSAFGSAAAGTLASSGSAVAAVGIARNFPTLPYCIEEWLYLGGYEQASDPNIFVRLGINAVVNVTLEREVPTFFAEQKNRSLEMGKRVITYLRCGIADTTKDDLKAAWEAAVPFIARHLSDGKSVLVHCHQGLSRSVAIIYAFLMIQRGLTLEAAQRHLGDYTQHGAKPRPNSGFIRQLTELDAQLKAARVTENDGVLSASGGVG